MGWLDKFCRNAGLMIHNIADPYNKNQKRGKNKVISKKVEHKKVSPSVTLRKTTIEEVEMHGENNSDK